MVERQEVQTPIYYISRVLTASEVNYSVLEKLVLALVHASIRLSRYFQAHIIEVLTSYPLQQVLRRPELSGRLAKRAIELGGLDIEFKGRTTVKGQVLADFVVEIPGGTHIDDGDRLVENGASSNDVWLLYATARHARKDQD
jgi:hypothetical protein